MTYILTKTETGKKAGKYLYTVKNQFGEVITERTSNRDYVACTIDGRFFFGRTDLIGKADHGRYVKRMNAENKIPVSIAYLQN
mgnify:CR=1 FL=1